MALFGGLFKKSGPGDEVGAALPSHPAGLLIVGLVQGGIFLALLAMAWVFSRYRAQDILVRAWAGLATVWQGLVYSVLMRVGLGLTLGFVMGVALLVGLPRETLEQFLRVYGAGSDKLVDPAAVQNPLYLLLLTTFISFGVAGLCEELWRAGTLVALLKLLPQGWTERLRLCCALLASSALFGVGHILQGPISIGLTALLGVVLGGIMLRHNSIWPAVMAHGFFNAASFVMLAVAQKTGTNLP